MCKNDYIVLQCCAFKKGLHLLRVIYTRILSYDTNERSLRSKSLLGHIWKIMDTQTGVDEVRVNEDTRRCKRHPIPRSFGWYPPEIQLHPPRYRTSPEGSS